MDNISQNRRAQNNPSSQAPREARDDRVPHDAMGAAVKFLKGLWEILWPVIFTLVISHFTKATAAEQAIILILLAIAAHIDRRLPK